MSTNGRGSTRRWKSTRAALGVVVVGVVGAVVGGASARGAVGPGQDGGGGGALGVRDLKRVEATQADTSPLAGGLRAMPTDLRMPNDFGGVYQIPFGSGTRYDGWFVRVRGGTYAVFPRSVYEEGRNGLRPTVPPGTIYLTGGIPRAGDAASGLGPGAGLGAGPGAARVGEPIDLSVDAFARARGRADAEVLSTGRVDTRPVDARVDGQAEVRTEATGERARVRVPLASEVQAAPPGGGTQRDATAAPSTAPSTVRNADREESWRRLGEGLMLDEELRGRRVNALLARAARDG
jgi:hypothetical protein